MLDANLLLTFVTVCEKQSFSEAARALGRGQSTISQHIKLLEAQVGQRLLDRTTHHVVPNREGDALLEQARRVLEAHERLERFVKGSELRGKLRLGASEDFVYSALPSVLARFARRHPAVDIELSVGLSVTLYQRFDAGGLDVILAKRRPGDERGRLAWREDLAWIAAPDYRVDAGSALPLLLYPPPSITRVLAIEALEAAGRSWRVAFTSGSLSGLTAAGKAGLGLIPHSARLLPAGLAVVPQSADLPRLPSIEFVVLGTRAGDLLSETLADEIISGATAAG